MSFFINVTKDQPICQLCDFTSWSLAQSITTCKGTMCKTRVFPPLLSRATFLQFSAKVRLCYTIINCLLENSTLKHLTFPMFYWTAHKNKMLAASDRWTRFWNARETHWTAMARCTSQVWFVQDWYFRNGPKIRSEYRNMHLSTCSMSKLQSARPSVWPDDLSHQC